MLCTIAKSLDEVFTDFVDEPDVLDEAAHIHEYLLGNITVQIVAQRLAQSLQTRNLSTGDDLYDMIVKNVIVVVAEEWAPAHDALVALLGTLKQQSETSNFESRLVPVLDAKSREYGDPDYTYPCQQDIRDAWTNLNHFAALVYKANLQDLSSFAFGTLSMAWKRKGWKADYGVPSDNTVTLEGHAPAAAQWILVCGQRLYNKCSEVKEKWGEWEGGLDWIVAQGELYDATQSLCERALAEMRRIRTASL
ncbi:hypothetical protein DXG01_003135 [Tephrocybe rancida]|nr:hypothetical protein DXG01_003135 [Tephrocybe rancida]